MENRERFTVKEERQPNHFWTGLKVVILIGLAVLAAPFLIAMASAAFSIAGGMISIVIILLCGVGCIYLIGLVVNKVNEFTNKKT